MAENGNNNDAPDASPDDVTNSNETKPETKTNGHATPETNPTLPNGDASKDTKQDGEPGESAEASPPTDSVLKLRVDLPTNEHVDIMVSSQEQVQDIRQSIVDQPHTFQYSCFHLEYKGKRINDFVELSEEPELAKDSEPVLKLVEDPYTEAQARMHVVRVRELIGAAGNRVDYVSGIDAGTSLCEDVEVAPTKTGRDDISHVEDYDLNAPGPIAAMLAKTREPAPKTVKSVSLSAWNPPPHHLRMRGHLLYLQATTLEGDQYYITSHVTGFYVNRSTNAKFDPEPRVMSKLSRAHSLITLLSQVSDKFAPQFVQLQEYNGQRDPLASYALSNSIPAAPWLVSPSSGLQHQADLTRTQEPYLLAGADNAETLRDWNEEFQSTRELPKENVQDRVFRERLTSKLFAEYTEAAVRGAVLVGRGEVQPLNPTEAKDAQIFVYNNVFYSFGADGVGTFTSDGGDEAARVATGKDVQGVKAVNQLDINGLFTAGTVVVDYLGKRIVGQSIVPGIFKQRDPGEHQIDYGGVEGKDVIASHEAFVGPFAELSKAMRVKRHAVWDKEGKKHELEGSVETKGLLGTDGRKYVLDLYRVTPLDIAWLEMYRGVGEEEDEKRYPHRMTVLRPELVDSFRIMRLREYIKEELGRKQAKREEEAGEAKKEDGHAEVGKLTNGDAGDSESKGEEAQAQVNGAQETNGEQASEQMNGDHDSGEKTDDDSTALTNGDAEASKDSTPVASKPQETVDVSGFSFTLNPDVFSGQQPQTDDEKAELARDEADVREVCKYLTADVLPRMIREMQEGDIGFPMDGQNLVRDMHKRGVNARYLGTVARSCAEMSEKIAGEWAALPAEKQEKERKDDKRLEALRLLAVQEMVARAFKHVCNRGLKGLPPCFAQSCVSHLLNCLVGVELNGKPEVEVDEQLRAMYPEADFGFVEMTPERMRVEVLRQIALRYRYDVPDGLVQAGKELQLLREICLKMGFQLEAKEYRFTKDAPVEQTVQKKPSTDSLEVPQTNGVHPPAEGGGKKKNKKKHNGDHSPNRAASASPVAAPTTFRPENVLNIVPIVKEPSPRSMLAEEALDAGRMSIQQDQKDLGQELLLESLSLHEQIYGILHPEVARVYYALSTLYYGLDEKSAAVELAKKAVIVSERTLGVDNPDTILAYLNLSLMEHATGRTRDALAYVRHALDLWKLVYGARHPDSITTINNAAVMLQTLKHFHESRRWFEVSLDLCQEVAGRNSVNTATLLFQYAQALALDHDSKTAVERMRASRDIFSAVLGPGDQNTREADAWLRTLVQSAVNQGKAAKEAGALLQSSGGQRRLFMRNGGAGGGGAATGRAARLGGMSGGKGAGQLEGAAASTESGVVETAAETAVRSSGLDKRSLDELVRYVNGEKQERTTPKKTTNPKRRQQRAQ
ncbi:Intracellular distribution of mitochondria [Friedmanniomyces endolithicus]|nr:Intracellular distribution of mitochondria [Friedmanniomyces endolithicus]